MEIIKSFDIRNEKSVETSTKNHLKNNNKNNNNDAECLNGDDENGCLSSDKLAEDNVDYGYGYSYGKYGGITGIDA